MIAGAAASGLVAVLFDGRSALSMAAVIGTSSLLALISYWLLVRPAESRIHSAEAPAAIEGATDRWDRATLQAHRLPWKSLMSAFARCNRHSEASNIPLPRCLDEVEDERRRHSPHG
jgi:hypothetical protein